MKKILKISLLAVIFYLCIVPYQYTNAENETDQNTQQEESNSNTETNQNEEKSQEQNETNTSTENQNESSSTQTEPTPSENTTPTEETTPSENQNPADETNEQSKAEEQNLNSNQQQGSQNKNSQSKNPVQTRTQSNNANLSDLGITPNDFKGFRSATLEYSVTVPNDVEKVNVYAKTQDPNAKITSGTGNQNLNVGENAIQVVVTAEDGNTQTYTINVKREEKAQEENQTPEIVPTSDLKKLEVKGYKLTPNFSANVYEYKLNVKQDVEELEIITEKQNDKVSVEVVGNTDLQEGENTITILVKNSETNNNTTYQIIVNKAETVVTTNESANVAINKAKKIRRIGLGILAIVAVGIVVFFIIKNKKLQEDDDFEYEEESEEDESRIDLNEEEELFKRVNKDNFKPIEEDASSKEKIESQEEKNATKETTQSNSQNEEDHRQILENYFKDSDDKRKGKHF